jgi:steroid delta-isomerase
MQTYIKFFEGLTHEDLPRFDSIFSADVHFKDPFNDVHGLSALKQIFSHMFQQCEDTRFEVTDACQCGDRAFLRWDFHFTPKGRAGHYRLHGLSRICFDGEGRVCEHIDYWDPAEQLYRHVPVIGWLLARLRRRLSASIE